VDLDLDLVPQGTQRLGQAVDPPAVGHLVPTLADADHLDRREPREAVLARLLVDPITLPGPVDQSPVGVVVLDGDQCSFPSRIQAELTIFLVTPPVRGLLTRI